MSIAQLQEGAGSDNTWMVDAVIEGVRQEKEMTILGLDVNDAFAQDNTFTHEENEGMSSVASH